MNDVEVVGMVESLECPLESSTVADGAGDQVGKARRERDWCGRNGSELILHKEGSRAGAMESEERYRIR